MFLDRCSLALTKTPARVFKTAQVLFRSPSTSRGPKEPKSCWGWHFVRGEDAAGSLNACLPDLLFYDGEGGGALRPKPGLNLLCMCL